MQSRSWSGRLLSVLIFSLTASEHSYAQSDIEKFRRRTLQEGRELNQDALKAGRDINKAAIQAPKDLERFGENVGKEGERTLDRLNRLGDEICKEICKLGCGSAKNCSCSCSGGVAVDDQGNVKGYNPTTGETHQGTKQSAPSVNTASLEAFKASLDPRGFWWIEQTGPTNRIAIRRDYTAAAVPSRVVRFYPQGQVRESTRKDRAGGMFWSPRAKPATRFHASFDFINQMGSQIYAPISGTVTRLSNPGTPGLTGLVIEQELGNGRKVAAVVFYVEVKPEIKQRLERNATLPPQQRERIQVEGGRTVLGTAQNITTPERYGPTTPQHFHVSLFDHNGNYLALDEKLERVVTETVIKKTPKQAPVNSAKK